MPALSAVHAVDAARLIAEGEASSEELVRSCLERIAERDPVIHAWAHLDPEAALAQARAADAADEPHSPLHGVPVGVKDIFDTRELPTECGTPIYAGRRPDSDAACVARLRRAGAVILGKTATTELAYFHPAQTRNPLDPDRTPGGSSSGSAAAVGDGMVPLALGSQTAGSTIRPASFCGVLGLKPTHGLLDLTGAKRLSARLDTLGLFARSVEDLGLLLEALGGGPAAAPAAAAAPRIAFARTARWELVEADARAALEGAARELEDAGARVDDLALPTELEALVEAQETIMAVDVAANLADEYDRHGDRISFELSQLIEAGRSTDPATYRAALEAAERGGERFPAALEGYDVLMTPGTRGQAPRGLDATGDPLFCRAWTLLGTPAISVPGPVGEDGLPIGVQLVAASGRDGELLAAARWVREALA